MNNKGTFFITTVLTTAVFVAGHFANATRNGDAVRSVAASTGKVVMEECQVTGELVRKEDGVYAVFRTNNDSGTTRFLNFYYAVTCTPAMSLFSRMVPMPKEIKKGCVAMSAEAGKNSKMEFLVQKAPERAEKVLAVETAAGENRSRLLLGSPEIWMLTVSLDDISPTPAGGVAPIVAAGGNTIQGKGVSVLARTTHKELKINS